ncbi:hypothetical protein ACIRD8_36905 [Streptomyces sp. NPDC102451]|uniref:hypothetical protein n=1 Tax=Streptomyces sp. NPDC102451 TaxID=3366177 RepID=UPI0037F1A9F4
MKTGQITSAGEASRRRLLGAATTEADAVDTVRGLVARGLGIELLPHGGTRHPGMIELPLHGASQCLATRALALA